MPELSLMQRLRRARGTIEVTNTKGETFVGTLGGPWGEWHKFVPGTGYCILLMQPGRGREVVPWNTVADFREIPSKPSRARLYAFPVVLKNSGRTR